MRELAAKLIAAGINAVREDELLAQHSSWRVGGRADVFAEPRTRAQVSACVAAAAQCRAPLLVVGHGTNVLFADGGFRGLVVKLGPAFDMICVDGARIVAQAGAWVPRIAMIAMRSGLSGLEHTIGIPGTIGGLVVMNGGSKRQSVGSLVKRVAAVDGSGAIITLDNAACRFGYRSSIWQSKDWIVCSVELELVPDAPHAIRSECLKTLRERRRKFPRKDRSCGSVFLSTPEAYEMHGPPGRIIEQVGLKGFSIGDAIVSSQHANFVLNKGRATAQDILRVIQHMRRTVLRRTGVELACEVKCALEDGRIVAAHDAFI